MSFRLSAGQRAIVLAMLAVLAALVLFGRPFVPSLSVAVKKSPYTDFATIPDSPNPTIPAVPRPAKVLPAVIFVHRKRRPHRRLHPVAHAIPEARTVPVPSPEPLDPNAAPVGAIQSYALSLVGGVQCVCLQLLWNRESGWQWWAANPSGAYGIPQALPGSKMAVAGADWKTNPYTQVKWGVVYYIDPTYGNACNAWAHEQASGWY